MNAKYYKDKENTKNYYHKKSKYKKIKYIEVENNLNSELSIKEEMKNEKGDFDRHYTEQIKANLVHSKNCPKVIQPFPEHPGLNIIEMPLNYKKKPRKKIQKNETYVTENKENIEFNEYILVDSYDVIEDFEII